MIRVNDVNFHSLDGMIEPSPRIYKKSELNATFCTFLEDFGRLLESRLIDGIVTSSFYGL